VWYFVVKFQLSGEEERVPAEPVVLAMVIPPQVEESTHQNSGTNLNLAKLNNRFNA
jgi:hypothetical protein